MGERSGLLGQAEQSAQFVGRMIIARRFRHANPGFQHELAGGLVA